MAKFYWGQNQLAEKLESTRKKTRRYARLILLGFVVMSYMTTYINNWVGSTMLFGIQLIIFGIILFSGFRICKLCDKFEVLDAGVKGEDKAQATLRSLDNEYSVIPNAKITFEDNSNEIDIIVVGPSGVYIIENKNHIGQIFGTTSNKQWVHRKFSSSGTAYDEEMYSPVKQVGIHTYRLAGILRQAGINVRIKNAVFFSNPDTLVSITNDDNNPVKIFFGPSAAYEILYWINHQPVILSEEDISRIVQTICSNSTLTPREKRRLF